MENWKVRTCSWILQTFTLVLWLEQVKGQSCGPRVSARLLAEIPCDMSKSSYCSAPGSAYPWSSVKRYISDNQGLVRRMYGDEKHSAVLINEVDDLRHEFDQLRAYMRRGSYSRTEYGRSARGSRRQPRPQIFDDDDEEEETPATIFRVVTETSIKVGDPVTRPSVRETPTTSYEPATDYGSVVPGQTPAFATTTDGGATTTSSSSTSDSTTTTFETTEDEWTASPTNATTSELPTTAKNRTYPTETTLPTTTAATAGTTAEELPVAMERIGYQDVDDYDYEPGRKASSGVLQNSVEVKSKPKPEPGAVKKADPAQYNEAESTYVVRAEDREQDTGNKTEDAVKDKEDEEVPRRGINACPVKNEVIAPYWANNTRGETLALLNVHPFEQYVHFEKCAFENHQMLCREGCRCEQQYRLHRLLAFDPKNECRGIFSDWFRFPSCCVCICYDLTPDIPRARGRRKGRMK